MEEKISVIIPVYNREQYIEECIRSLQEQTCKNLEILLIDDGSTDNTAALCRAMAETDPRILLLAGDHGGVSAARNKGLSAATGKYVFFLDSDDVIHPLLLETLAVAMEQTNAPISGTQVCNVPQKYWQKVSEAVQKDQGPGETKKVEHEEALHSFFTQTTPINLVGGVMMRADWIGQTRFRTDLYIGEDFYFIYENLIKGASAVFLRQKWYYGRLHNSNSSWDFKLSGFMNRLYRRELVWKSEEALGRTEYANTQKRSVFGFYLDFLQKDTMSRGEKLQMRNVMKQYKKTLFPAFSLKTKVIFYLSVSFPLLCAFVLRSKKKWRQGRK